MVKNKCSYLMIYGENMLTFTKCSGKNKQRNATSLHKHSSQTYILVIHVSFNMDNCWEDEFHYITPPFELHTRGENGMKHHLKTTVYFPTSATRQYITTINKDVSLTYIFFMQWFFQLVWVVFLLSDGYETGLWH